MLPHFNFSPEKEHSECVSRLLNKEIFSAPWGLSLLNPFAQITSNITDLYLDRQLLQPIFQQQNTLYDCQNGCLQCAEPCATCTQQGPSSMMNSGVQSADQTGWEPNPLLHAPFQTCARGRAGTSPLTVKGRMRRKNETCLPPTLKKK